MRHKALNKFQNYLLLNQVGSTSRDRANIHHHGVCACFRWVIKRSKSKQTDCTDSPDESELLVWKVYFVKLEFIRPDGQKYSPEDKRM